jgi:hypothetical protein
MCYSEFNDIIQSIADMDADVITIETSRSQMELLDVFADFKYPNEIGPGVYDIHSPRVPNKDEMTHLLKKARAVIPDSQLWVNPDCGLKNPRMGRNQKSINRNGSRSKRNARYCHRTINNLKLTTNRQGISPACYYLYPHHDIRRKNTSIRNPHI